MKPMLLETNPITDLNLYKGKIIAEEKHNGIRLIAKKIDQGTILTTRDGKNATNQFPEVVHELKKIPHNFIIDGELCVIKDGNSILELVTSRLNTTTEPARTNLIKQLPATYMIFDILWLNGEDLTLQPLTTRRATLEQTIPEQAHTKLVVQHTDPKTLFEEVTKRGGEGIVLKFPHSIYNPGQRTSGWLKHKKKITEELVVKTYTTGKRAIASLVTDKGEVNLSLTATEYEKWVPKIQNKEPICITVEYLELTQKGKMRNPILKSIRTI